MPKQKFLSQAIITHKWKILAFLPSVVTFFILSVADLFYIISTCKIVLGTFTTTTTTTTTTPV